MSIEYPCVHWNEGKCKRFSDDKVTSWCVESPCKEQTPSNADRIRAMSDEELAESYADAVHYGPTSKKVTDRNEAINLWIEWLKQPAEGE